MSEFKLTLTVIVFQVIYAKDAYPTKARSRWALEWPGQTVLCISKLYWTVSVTERMPMGLEHMREYVDMCTYELNEIVSLVRGKLSTQNRTTLGREIKRANDEKYVRIRIAIFFCFRTDLWF